MEDDPVNPPKRFSGFVDLTPLRESRDFRLLWFSTIVSETGTQISTLAVFTQIYLLTRSAAAVGFVGLAKFVPLVLTTVLGGSIVDAVDRRKLLLATQMGFAVSSGVLLTGALMGSPPLALIYGAVALGAAVQGLDLPTRSAITPSLVSAEQLPGAMALKQVAWNATVLVGPLVGGLLIARAGLRWAYGLDMLSYLAALVATSFLRPRPPSGGAGAVAAANRYDLGAPEAANPANQTGAAGRQSGLGAIADGFKYLKGRRVLQSTFIIDLFAMVFGMPNALFVILAVEQFHGGSEIAGLLFAGPAFGAVVAALTSGWVNRISRQGLAVIISVAIWGAGITAFGLAGDRLGLALFFLAIAGAADVISAVFRSTILQLSVPDSLRGRLSSIHVLVVAGGPRLGDFEAGVVAEAFTPAVSVISGGVLTLVGVGLVAAFIPQLAQYRARQHGAARTIF